MSGEIEELPHPLFAPDDENDEFVQVAQIQVTRMEQGQAVYAPRMFQASELNSLQDIANEFGGGTYVLIARYNNRITTRRKFVIPGKSKPMFEEVASLEPPVQPVLQSQPMPAPMGSGDGMITLLVTMMQGMMQAQAQASQQSMQMMMAFMTQGTQKSAEEREAARAEMAANIERERLSAERTMAMMREMMSNRPSGSGEEFAKGVEFMRMFAMNQIETARTAAKGDGEDGIESLLGTAMQALQGWNALQELKNPANAAATAVAAQ
jgi:hypothetical protein